MQGYQNRSEAFRDLLRGELGKDSFQEESTKWCVGTLRYVYDYGRFYPIPVDAAGMGSKGHRHVHAHPQT
jgi:hypothetical protein